MKKKSAVHRQDNTSVKVEKKPNNSIQSDANNTKRDNLPVTLPRGYTVIVIESKLSGTKKMRRQNVPIVTGTGKKKQVMITVDDTNHIVYVHGGVYTQEAIMKLREKLQ